MCAVQRGMKQKRYVTWCPSSVCLSDMGAGRLAADTSVARGICRGSQNRVVVGVCGSQVQEAAHEVY